MKEKISRLAGGKFDYKDPEIELSLDRIELEATCGKTLRGSFDVRSKKGIEIRAMVFSSVRWMKLLTPSFTGAEALVEYEFDSSAMEAGDIIDGSFTLVTNGGEIKLPFTVKVLAPYYGTEEGRINDLDQFAVLAKRDWREALDIFTGDEFEKVFLRSKKDRRLYRMLSAGSDPSLAMEEFLCSVFRKDAVSISVSEAVVEYMDLTDVISGSLVIEKNTWGHIKIDVSVTGDFITVFTKELSGESFLGSFCQLEYRVRPTPGRLREGQIALETFSQRIEVPVRCCYSPDRSERSERRKRARRSLTEFFDLLCRYELRQISREKWLSGGREAINGCLNNSEDTIFRIMEADFLTDAGWREEAGLILGDLSERELRYRSAIDYLYYLYVNARYRDDEQYTEYVIDTIRIYAEGQYSDRWEPTVMLIRLENPSGVRAVKAFAGLSSLYDQGSYSPLLFLEALKLVNRGPSLVREAGSFERSLFIWAMRRSALSRECVFQYADISMRLKQYHPAYMYSLMTACETFESKDILSAVMHMLCLGQCMGERYVRWYQLGIESALRTPDMYENYMASLDLDKEPQLPYAVLIYFQYDNSLPVRQRAYLYRYVLQNRERYESIFKNYNGIIRAFALEQLSKAGIDRNLAILYDHYLRDENLTPHVLRSLPSVMFKQRMKLPEEGRNISRVILDYEELEEDLCYERDEYGDIYVDIFMEGYRVLFEDREGGRHILSLTYSLEKLLDESKYLRRCFEECPDEPMLLLGRSEKVIRYQMIDEASIGVCKRSINLNEVSRPYKKTLLKNLVEYYYDSYEGETLEKYLVQIDPEMLEPDERGNIIEYYIQRGLFEKAYNTVIIYGYENIQIKRLMRLCSRMIRVKEYQEEEFLTTLAAYVFSGGRYDETILTYLDRYYSGPVDQLYAVWSSARDFEVAAHELEERLLCEALFTEKMLDEAGEVFVSYYGSQPDMRIVRAFLALYSYRYLRDMCPADRDLFSIMEIEFDHMEAIRDICAIALIKYAAVDEGVINSVDTDSETGAFMDRGIILPFFTRFAGNARVPLSLVDMSYVTCCQEPGSDILISYRLSGSDDEYVTGSMEETVAGIYVRAFRLLPGESFEYMLTRCSDEGEEIIFRGTVSGSEREASGPLYGADALRAMIAHVESGDDGSLEEDIRKYDIFDELTERLFHLR